jgi:hypothetical protein
MLIKKDKNLFFCDFGNSILYIQKFYEKERYNYVTKNLYNKKEMRSWIENTFRGYADMENRMLKGIVRDIFSCFNGKKIVGNCIVSDFHDDGHYINYYFSRFFYFDETYILLRINHIHEEYDENNNCNLNERYTQYIFRKSHYNQKICGYKLSKGRIQDFKISVVFFRPNYFCVDIIIENEKLLANISYRENFLVNMILSRIKDNIYFYIKNKYLMNIFVCDSLNQGKVPKNVGYFNFANKIFLHDIIINFAIK